MLFADLVGSTELGEDDPERTRLLIDRFFAAMREEIERVGGTIEKYAGDAVMAAFGAPAALEDHAERALHAALAMQRRVRELGDRLELRIGVNTGEVVVDGAPDGTFVTGDAVNVCARLEQNAAPGQVLVGERTAQAARGAFVFGDAVAVAAKGKSRPVEARELVRATAAVRPRGAIATRFVGRERELAELVAAYETALSTEQPRLALLVGDAGVGKSRLVREFWASLEARTDAPALLVGRCLSYGSAITYWPIREILTDHLDLPEGLTLDELRARLGTRPALSLALGVEPPGDLHPLAVRDRFRDECVDLLDAIVATTPLILVVEDVHWAEEPLLELLERVVRDVQGPLLLVATTRPEGRWGGGRRAVTTVELEPLSPEAGAELVSEYPAEVRELLLAQAEGNPFFVEELVESLIDNGLLVRRDGGWEATELVRHVEMPDSVRALLAARIDLLPPREKAALQAGAVIGRRFWEGPVRELVGGDADFALLEERGFIRRARHSSLTDEREHSIKHALTREAAYTGIPKGQRARLHAVFARWIEGRDSADSFASLLAHHYAEAARPEDADIAWAGEDAELADLRARAVIWLRAAGEAAIGRYELESAIALLGRALDYEPDEAEASAIWRQIGRAHAFRYEGEAFWTAMESSLSVCHDRETCGATYADLAFETAIRSGMWQTRPDEQLVLGWIDSARELSRPGTPAHVKSLLARAFWLRGNREAASEAAQLADRIGDAQLQAFAALALSANEMAVGSYRAAHEAAERALTLAAELENPDAVTGIYESAIPAFLVLGRLDDGRQIARDHEQVCERLSPHHRVHGRSVKLEVAELAGEWEGIVAAAEEMAEAVEDNLETPCIRNSRSLLLIASAAATLGDEATADRFERRAQDVVAEGYDAVLAGPRARLLLARGAVDELEALVPHLDSYGGESWFALANHSVRLDVLAELGAAEALERDAAPFVDSGTYLEPFALRALGRVRGDEAMLQRSLAGFEALGLGWHAEETRRLLGSRAGGTSVDA